uniref:Putative secreted peptide n=1 Tax=Anopheles braziliensis TaxID=58242 RepID=A0A2M3ZMD5_9DIPT
MMATTAAPPLLLAVAAAAAALKSWRPLFVVGELSSKANGRNRIGGYWPIRRDRCWVLESVRGVACWLLLY